MGKFRRFIVFVLTQIPQFMLRMVLAILPGSSSVWGPPRRFRFASELAKKAGLKWIQVYSSSPETYPICERDLPSESLRDAFRHGGRRQQGVIEVSKSLVLSHHGVAVATDDTMIIDATFNLNGKAPHMLLELLWLRPKDKRVNLSGLTLNLGSSWSSINYGHMMLDSLSRLHLVQEAGYNVKEFNHILLPKFRTKSLRDLISKLGIENRQIVDLERGSVIECETLVQPTHPCGNTPRIYPPWVPQFLRNTMKPEGSSSGRRIYIKRPKGRRSIKNEECLVDFLKKYGFEELDAGNNKEGLGLFQEADVILGAHGAGLSDIVFCKPETRLIEILPESWKLPYFYSLAHANGMSYRACVGSKVNKSGEFHVSFKELIKLIE